MFSEWIEIAKWPRYITSRPPVKFRSIWRPFDAPTINRVTAKASCVLQLNTPPKQPINPSKPLPCPPSLDHDRVGENYTSFGHSHLLLCINRCPRLQIRGQNPKNLPRRHRTRPRRPNTSAPLAPDESRAATWRTTSGRAVEVDASGGHGRVRRRGRSGARVGLCEKFGGSTYL